MSQLQLGLLAIGVIVVVFVLAYNKLLELRYRRKVERALGDRQDVLMGEANSVGLTTASNASESSQMTLLPSGEMKGSESEDRAYLPLQEDDSQVDSVALPVTRNAAGISQLIDYVLTISNDTPIDCALANQAISPIFGSFSKLVIAQAYVAQESCWVPLSASGEARQLQIGMQLADRRGPVSDDELSRFRDAVDGIARFLGARVDGNFVDPLTAALSLDQFCAEVDVQIAINVLAGPGGFSGEQIAAFAHSRGFVLEEDGRFHCSDASGRDICILQNGQKSAFVTSSLASICTQSITFELDVPRCPGTPRSFDDCLAIANGFASLHDGQLVDDNGNELTSAGLAAIREQIEPLFAAMAARGIAAGSPLALRLFA